MNYPDRASPGTKKRMGLRLPMVTYGDKVGPWSHGAGAGMEGGQPSNPTARGTECLLRLPGHGAQEQSRAGGSLSRKPSGKRGVALPQPGHLLGPPQGKTGPEAGV